MQMRTGQHAIRVAVAATALLGALTAHTTAHPHMWVSVEVTVLYDQSAFTGLHEKWIFDEYYTAMAIEGLDKNNDGIYSREELAELAKVNIDGIKEYGYFTFPLLAGKQVKLRDPKDYWLEHKDGLLSLHFTVLFEQPIPVKAKDFAFVVQDPEFYIAFLPAKTDPVIFGPGTPKSCKVTIGNPKHEGENDADRLAKAFAQLAAPVSATKAVFIRCGSG
jgi:ABC-type uncharacterized transport system substrate-binding protein